MLSHHKLLGLIIDKDLSFEAHIDELCKKLSKRLGLLRYISPYLKQRHKLTFYLATVKPVMLYLSPIWSSCNKELLERVLKTDAERTTRTLTMFNNRSNRFANLNFHCPVFKKNTEGGQTFSVQTVRNWNELSMDVKKVKNVKYFKKKLHTNLIAKQKETGNFEYLS